MDKQAFYDEALRIALETGCEAAEVYASQAESFSVNVLDGTFDRYESSVTGGVSLRVRRGGNGGPCSLSSASANLERRGWE